MSVTEKVLRVFRADQQLGGRAGSFGGRTLRAGRPQHGRSRRPDRRTVLESSGGDAQTILGIITLATPHNGTPLPATLIAKALSSGIRTDGGQDLINPLPRDAALHCGCLVEDF